MITNPEFKQEKAQRLLQIFSQARQRYLESGGNPNHSANKKWMTEAEQKEFLELGEQIFDEEYVKNFLEKKQKSFLT